MKAYTTFSGGLGRLKAQILRGTADRRGVAAIEFAFIAPVLLALYFLTMEFGQGIETNKKVGRVASMVADLVTQQSQEVKHTELEAIMEIGESILQPYNRSAPRIVITGIDIGSVNGSELTAKVAWSRQMENGVFSRPFTEGSTTIVPEQLMLEGTFLVRVDTHLEYQPVIAWTASQKDALGLAAAFDDIDMRETYFLRPRMSTRIKCDGC